MTDNAFVAEATTSSANKTFSDKEVIDSFFLGVDASSLLYHSRGSVLFYGSEIVARRTPSNSIILPKNSHRDVDINDYLIGKISHLAIPYIRLDSFSQITSPTIRIKDLESDKFSEFSEVAKLFGFEYSQADFNSITRSREFKNRVTQFFTLIEEKEKEEARIAQEEANKELSRKESISWDTGEGEAVNPFVKGSGGGQRLRLRSGSSRTIKVETSRGHELTLKQAKRSWDFASKYWHGGKKIENSSWSSSRGAVLRPRSSYGYKTVVTNSTLKFGCQDVTRKEAERFASSMGWARAIPEG
jgi:hypothetical protein